VAGLLERRRIRSSAARLARRVGSRCRFTSDYAFLEPVALMRAGQPRNRDNFLTTKSNSSETPAAADTTAPWLAGLIPNAPGTLGYPLDGENLPLARQMRHSCAPRASFSKFPIGQLDRG